MSDVEIPEPLPSISIVVTRADGTVEDLGVVAAAFERVEIEPEPESEDV